MQPQQYAEIVENSIFTPEGIEQEYGIPARNVRDWSALKRSPRPENKEKFEEVLMGLQSKPKMQRHPSYGWATPEQIKDLERLGLGPTRDKILKDIEKQNKMRGKVK